VQPQYHVFYPRPPLATYVDHFWLLEDYPAARIEKLLPDGGLELILNLGEPQFLHELQDPSRYRTFCESWVSGLRSQAILIGSPSLSNLIGVRFRMFGAYPFLHLPLHEISDRVVDADAICGPEVHRLRDRIAAAASPSSKFAIFEKFLLGRWKEPVRHERLMSQAVHTLAAAGGEDRIEHFSRRAGLSGKHLRRLFQTMVGLSPKSLFRVCRLQRVLRRIEELATPNWSRLAQECGFFDQAHFNNEFKAFTNLTPTEYLGQRGPFLNYLPAGESASQDAV
jgi:AraC-like DNA-binding protein